VRTGSTGPGRRAAERRRENVDETKVVSRSRIGRFCRRSDVPLRDRTLWRMLYETSARAAEVLSLDIEKLDVANRRAPVVVEGGDTRWITWGTDTGRLLPRLIAGGQCGPLFLSECRPGPRRRGNHPPERHLPGARITAGQRDFRPNFGRYHGDPACWSRPTCHGRRECYRHHCV
jgi:integrase